MITPNPADEFLFDALDERLWIQKAITLRTVGDIVWKEAMESFRKVAPENGIGFDPDAYLRWGDILYTAHLLYAYAVENLLKALIISPRCNPLPFAVLSRVQGLFSLSFALGDHPAI